LITLAIGIGLYFSRSFLVAAAKKLHVLAKFGPDAVYQLLLASVLKFAAWHTRKLQTGILRDYIRVTAITTVLMVGAALVRAGGFQRWENLSPVSVRIVLVAVLMILATFATVHSKSRLRSILSLGVVGYSMAMLFTFFGAPDLAMTQLVIETLTVILLALAFYHLPTFSHGSTKRTRSIDIIIAVAVGITISLLVLAALHVQTPTLVSDYYLDHSYNDAHGRNVVNVILVDFRALDTLGEITVLTIAALGAFALLKLKPKKGGDSE
jgi:multicomponent Na+:H+ antiporter subunit A